MAKPIKELYIRTSSGVQEEPAPIGADAEYIFMKNGNTLEVDNTLIKGEINKLKNNDSSFSSQIESINTAIVNESRARATSDNDILATVNSNKDTQDLKNRSLQNNIDTIQLNLNATKTDLQDSITRTQRDMSTSFGNIDTRLLQMDAKINNSLNSITDNFKDGLISESLLFNSSTGVSQNINLSTLFTGNINRLKIIYGITKKHQKVAEILLKYSDNAELSITYLNNESGFVGTQQETGEYLNTSIGMITLDRSSNSLRISDTYTIKTNISTGKTECEFLNNLKIYQVIGYQGGGVIS